MYIGQSKITSQAMWCYFVSHAKTIQPVYDFDLLTLYDGKRMHANLNRDIVYQSTYSAVIPSWLCHWGNKFLLGIVTREITVMVVDLYYVLGDITAALFIVENVRRLILTWLIWTYSSNSWTTLSVHPSVFPCVDRIVSSLYLPQY